MNDELPTRRAMRHSAKRPPKRLHPLGWLGIGLAVALIALVGWVGVRALMAKNELESALPLLSELKDSLKAVDFSGAQTTVAVVAAKTANASSLTSDPVWRAFESVPVVGPNLQGFRELAGITNDIVTGVLVPVAGLGDTLNPKALKPVDGRIDVALFAAAVPVVHGARGSLESAYANLQGVDTSEAVGAIADAQTKLETMLEPLIPVVKQADEFVALVPGLLGADGARNYLVVFQNNSEARALGGHAGSWVQVAVDDGKISLARQSSVFDLKTGGVAVLDLDPNVRSLWSGAAEDPSNVTLVPRLDLAAQTAQAFWLKRFGVSVDAVVFIDPVALGYILDATGPITVPTGDVIDTTNASRFLLNGVYLKYPKNEQQDQVFGSIARLVFGAITSGDFDPGKLVGAAIKSGNQHRLLTWFFDPDVEAAFAATPFNLKTPQTTDSQTEFGVYVTDNLGSKMTYYVDAKVELGQATCSTGEGRYEVKVTMTNKVSATDGPKLPNYVANKSAGGLRVLVTLYAPPGTTFVRELAAGWDPTFVTLVGSDGEYPVMTQRITLQPEQTLTGTYVLKALDGPMNAKLKAYVTPLARATPVSAFEFTC